MIFETSRQARFMIPMAISLGFGILFATVITLILVPCLYLVVENSKLYLQRAAGRQPAPAGGSLLQQRGDPSSETMADNS
jgi:hypothetical protein